MKAFTTASTSKALYMISKDIWPRTGFNPGERKQVRINADNTYPATGTNVRWESSFTECIAGVPRNQHPESEAARGAAQPCRRANRWRLFDPRWPLGIVELLAKPCFSTHAMHHRRTRPSAAPPERRELRSILRRQKNWRGRLLPGARASASECNRGHTRDPFRCSWLLAAGFRDRGRGRWR